MLSGDIILNGDKSISHRILIFAALSEGKCTIKNLSKCKDVQRTSNILKQCNISINNINNKTIIMGGRLYCNTKRFYCGNSGSTARFMLGLLPSNGINGTLYGDKSLSLRPMNRVIIPLQKMKIRINRSGGMLPISFKASNPGAIKYSLQTPSAQVKTAMIFSALSCKNKTYITDPFGTRDHTEKILQYLGHKDHTYYKFKIKKFNYTVAGDISNAAFVIAAAILIPKSNVTIKGVLYNQTRIGYIKTLKKMGANIKINNKCQLCNETIADIKIQYTPKLEGINLTGETLISMIDEIPILALVASFARGRTVISGAQELRYKESDRIKSIVSNLKTCNVNIKETKEGFIIKGPNILHNTSIKSFQDHRIAMTFEILKLVLTGKINKSMKLAPLIKTSFPEFYQVIRKLHV